MAKKSQDYIVYLRANNADLKKKLADSRARLKRHNASLGKLSKQAAGYMAGFFGIGMATQAIGSSIRKIADFEFQMDKVAAVSRASASEIKQLEKNALDLGASTQFTATEIGKLQEELARLGFSTDQIVNMTDASRKLATVADAELGESARTVGQVINAFGLEAKNSTEIANVMAESFSKSALDLEKFSVAMSNVGANAKAFGLSVAETTAMLGALVDAGIDASKAGTDLRTILIESNKAGLTLNEAFEQVRNSTDKLGTATELFGKRAGAAAIILADNEEKVKNLGKVLGDSTHEMDSMVKVMEDNLLTDWKLFTSAIDGFIQKGGAANGVLRGIVQTMTVMVNKLDDVIKGLVAASPLGFSAILSNEFIKFFDDVEEETGQRFNMFSDEVGKKIDLTKIFDKNRINIVEYGKTLTTTINEVTPVVKEFKKVLMGLSPKGIEFKDPFAEVKESMTTLTEELFGDTESFDGNKIFGLDRIEQKMKDTVKPIKGVSKEISSEMQHLNDILSMGLTDGIAAFTDGLATDGIDQAFKQLFDSIGSGLQNLGTALVAQGVALKAAISLGPAAKIAAGIAAIAAGALIKKASASIQSGYSNASISGGSGGGGSVSSGFQSQPIVLNGKLSVSTRELSFALEDFRSRDSRNR